MFFTDFEYDGERLSDYGCMVCTFDEGGLETVENGAQLTFNTVPVKNGTLNLLTSTAYETCIEATFQICKCDIQSDNDNQYLTEDDVREIMRWLNRKQYHKFRVLAGDYFYWYYEGSFNVSKIDFSGRICGLDLTFKSNRPFARQDAITYSFTSDGQTDNTAYCISDDEGYIYPDVEVTILEAGDLTINNRTDGRNTYIANCEAGEVITMKHPMIFTSSETHKIQNDFSWKFLRLVNSRNSQCNILYFSLPCEVKITYSPMIKIGI